MAPYFDEVDVLFQTKHHDVVDIAYVGICYQVLHDYFWTFFSETSVTRNICNCSLNLKNSSIKIATLVEKQCWISLIRELLCGNVKNKYDWLYAVMERYTSHINFLMWSMKIVSVESFQNMIHIPYTLHYII